MDDDPSESKANELEQAADEMRDEAARRRDEEIANLENATEEQKSEIQDKYD